jgi:pyridoxamine 5'-phosphate oxidase
MDIHQMFSRLDRILENSRVGILTTLDERGYPHSRWMTPTLVAGREGFIFAVTAPGFQKAFEIQRNPRVGWIFQTKALDEIITASGKINVIDNPSLRSEVQESLGRNLTIFWRVNPNESELVVLETVVEEMTYFNPVKNEKHHLVV